PGDHARAPRWGMRVFVPAVDETRDDDRDPPPGPRRRPAEADVAGGIHVVAASGRYLVHVGTGLLSRVGDLIPGAVPPERAFVVADREVAERFLAPVADSLASIGTTVVHLPVPQGEAAKTLGVAEAVYRQ